MNRDEINSRPLESDVSFRQRAVEPDNTECLTLDGRDRSLDYKIPGIFATKVLAGSGSDR
ncbi:hypothetical protein N8198_02315 [Gammaproteobacteria bacterium]|nr:hypothetical protein [Gammaproteobacteria bacterium]